MTRLSEDGSEAKAEGPRSFDFWYEVGLLYTHHPVATSGGLAVGSFQISAILMPSWQAVPFTVIGSASALIFAINFIVSGCDFLNRVTGIT